MEKEPEMAEFGPIWWVSHGTKMREAPHGSPKGELVLEGSAARLRISRFYNTRAEIEGWCVEYKIEHGCGRPFQTTGDVWMNDEELAAAFGVTDDFRQNNFYIIDRFGGTVAKQRKFIRYREFLNIPGPGTGYQGDPNISIKLYPETIAAVQNLLTPANQ